MVDTERYIATYVLPVYKREGVLRGEHVPDAEISICKRLPDGTVAELMEVYRADGEAIAKRLWDSLPGGTVDRVIVNLLEMRASLMKVGFLGLRELERAARQPTPDHHPNACRGECDEHR